MGMFDNLLKMADNSLKAIEEGALEKRLEQVADRLESGIAKASGDVEKVASAPEKMLNRVEQTHANAEEKAKLVQTHATKTIQVIQQD